MKEEEEERLPSENLGVESILQNEVDNFLARREKNQGWYETKINHLFDCNLDENQRKIIKWFG